MLGRGSGPGHAVYRAQTMNGAQQGHGGTAVTRTLKALDVTNIFTLTGGHIFPIFDGAKADDIRLVDVRHEQSAAFAAEGLSLIHI